MPAEAQQEADRNGVAVAVAVAVPLPAEVAAFQGVIPEAAREVVCGSQCKARQYHHHRPWAALMQSVCRPLLPFVLSHIQHMCLVY